MKAKLTDADKADIVRLVGKGQAIAVVATDFNCSEQTVRNVVKAAKKAEPPADELAAPQEPAAVVNKPGARAEAKERLVKALRQFGEVMLRDEISEALEEVFGAKAAK